MKETEAQHRTRILAAKAVRTYIIQHPGCTDAEILKATGHAAASAMRGIDLVRQELGTDKVRRWWVKAAPENPDEQISRTVAAVSAKHAITPVDHSTPLSVLLGEDDGTVCTDERGRDFTVHEVKREAWAAVLRWIFEKGPDPRVAMRRLYALAHEVGPQLLRDLTHEEIALLLGDGAGRATSSARSQAIFGGLKSALGIVTEFGTGHKSRGARDKMSESAKGNTNRRGRRTDDRGQIEQLPPQPIPGAGKTRTQAA